MAAGLPDLPAFIFPRDPTLRQFDDIYTAPRAASAALDYYAVLFSPLIPQTQKRLSL